ncbi:hypothetical protein ABQJ54_02100 [Rhodanobacter sp. Si-c]|uniref:DUF1376 domain-containing protein n=1 Tax=Rhodanobacter lycopersici TaxID=3162487 RepID=A0ABV3Q9N8_9GAMM
MARSRNIKPGFFKNEVLVELPYEYRLLFVGLWTIADRQGRFEDRPARIKMEVFPGDNVDVEAGLQALHDKGFILRYSAEGERYCQVLAWDKHQTPHVKEAQSTIPAPDKHSARIVQAPGKNHASTAFSGTSPSDSLIPDSLIQKPLAQRAERSTDPAAHFERFWSAYPRHVGKRAAVKALAKLRPDVALLDVMLAALARQRQSDQWQRDGGQFIPHAATWLNGRRWEDETEPARSDGVHGSPGSGDESWLRRAV